MQKVKFVLAVIIGKLSGVVLKIMGKKIPYYPGYIALKVDHDFLKHVGHPKTVLAVTGTNGKSTIAGMLTDFFKKQGFRTINNNGFNIETGIAAMFLKGTSIFGRLKADVAIMEVDEKTSGMIFEAIPPKYLICTNLFRDSMRANGNIDYIAYMIKKGIPKETKLILNADDVICCDLGSNKKNIYYGIKKMSSDASKPINLVCDLVYCPKCGKKLTYKSVRYHHLGQVECKACGFTNPKPDYEASITKNLEITHNGKKEIYPLITDSIFNNYNVLAVISILRELGYSEEEINESFSDIKIIDTRYTREKVKDILLTTHMAKGQNPVACSQVFNYVRNQEGDKVVMLMLDDVTDKRYSSETIAWYYDTDFEFLNDEHIKQIIVGGVRSKDVYVRMLLANIPKEKISLVDNEFDMYKKIKLKGIDNIFLLHDINACDQSKIIKSQIIDYIGSEVK